MSSVHIVPGGWPKTATCNARRALLPDPSIERTSESSLRKLSDAAHVKR